MPDSAQLRFARYVPKLADCVRSIQELAALGVRFVAITQNIDTDESNPAARLLLHIFAAFAEFERELIRERVVIGICGTGARYTAREAQTGIQAGPGLAAALRGPKLAGNRRYARRSILHRHRCLPGGIAARTGSSGADFKRESRLNQTFRPAFRGLRIRRGTRGRASAGLPPVRKTLSFQQQTARERRDLPGAQDPYGK
jgi:hypothetical protein